MNDDDNKHSPEFLREDRVEKNKRSVFEWLTGKEESEKDKLRKKLDKELKEAARKRAEEIEQVRAEQNQEEAETRKLKKKWRRRLLEKSKQQLEELQQDGAEPVDGYQMAQVMVAERIVHLHKMLDEDDLKKSEVKAVKIHIDFMGLLSEKLSQPELDMPAEIEEVYRAIVVSSQPDRDSTSPSAPEATPGRPHSPDVTNLPDRPTPEKPDPVGETKPELSLYGVAVASILTALRKVVRPERTATDGKNLSTKTDTPTATANPEKFVREPSVATATTNTRAVDQTAVTELHQAVQNMATPVDSLRRELSHQPTVERLAKIVAEAETAKHQEIFGTTPLVVAGTALSKRGSENLPESLRPEFVKTQAEVTKNESRPNQPEVAPKRDFETMTTGELVHLAENVPLGQGRYLATAFKRGEIGREDLIKVLKSHKKGLDYRQEFAGRAEKYRRQREASPEILRPPNDEPDQQTEKATNVAKTDKQSKTDDTEDNSALELNTPTAVAKQRATQANARLRQQSSVWLFYASVVLVFVVLIIVVVLLTS